MSTYNGGYFGYLLRRFIHVSIAIIPLIYYWYYSFLVAFITREQFVSLIVIIILCIEIIRLQYGFTFIGQRNYEYQQISAFAWGALSIGLVLLEAPSYGVNEAAFGLPLIWSLAFADPLMGEIRRFTKSSLTIGIVGGIAVGIIWLMAVIWLLAPWWVLPFIVPVTVISEMHRTSNIDDNATMLLIPLVLLLLIKPWL